MAAKPKGKAEAAAGEDQSMEEILQSIRKIIAEENDDAGEEPVKASSSRAAEEDVMSQDTPEEMEESEVLELTDIVQEDGSVVNAGGDADVLADIDDALEDAPTPSRAPMASKPAPKPAAPRVAAPVADSDALLSAASIAASAEALKALRHPAQGMGGMPFMSGNTVEGLVQVMLRPMLKEWLDANLPLIVQQVVEREVSRITSNLDE